MRDDERLNRRDMLAAGGIGLIGASLAGCGGRGDVVRAPAAPPQDPAAESDRAQLVRVPEGGDPAQHSLAENRFWCSVLRDHGAMFAMLMPGDELAGPRAEAERFRDTFARLFRRSQEARLSRENYREFNNEPLEQAKRFHEWKLRMRSEQASGRMRSLVWPSFFQAAAHEAQAAITRWERLNRGEVVYDRKEIADLWLSDAADHAGLIAHLLDPAEARWIHETLEAAKRFQEARATLHAPARPPANGEANGGRAVDVIDEAARERAEMEAAIEEAVAQSRVHSIIKPMMTDHMRREGLRFLEELKRAR